MLQNNSIFMCSRKLILVAVVAAFICCLPGPAYCQTSGPALLLQQVPENAGTITPGTGVHYLQQNTSVTLTAVPRPGFQFVYWLGDVREPTLNRTTTYLDAPKIVVAVFERDEYELEDAAVIVQSIPGGLRGGLRARAADYSRQGYSGGGGRRPSVRRPSAKPPEPPLPPPEVPVPIPEPATILLLALGSYLAFAGRRSKKIIRTKTGHKELD